MLELLDKSKDEPTSKLGVVALLQWTTNKSTVDYSL